MPDGSRKNTGRRDPITGELLEESDLPVLFVRQGRPGDDDLENRWQQGVDPEQEDESCEED